jgi:hypothetical protein
MPAEAAIVELRATSDKLAGDMKSATAVVQNFAAEVKATGATLGGAFNSIPASAKPANEAMTGLLGTLRNFKSEQVQQGRQAKFLANELTSIIPASDGAKAGIQGVLGVMIEGAAGGLSFGLALEGVKLAVSLVTMAFAEEKEAAAKAKKENDQVFAKLLADANAAAIAVQDFNAKARGMSPEALTARAGARDLEGPVKAAKERLDFARQQKALEESSSSTGQGSTDRSVAQWNAEIQIADKALLDLEQKKQAFLDRAGQIEQTAARETSEKVQAIYDAGDKRALEAERERVEKLAAMGAAYHAQAGKWEEEAAARREKKIADELDAETRLRAALWQLQVDQAERATALEKQTQTLRTQMAQQWTATGTKIGEAVGTAFAGIIDGTKSVGQAMAAMGKSILNTIIDMVKSVVMAEAVRAAAGGAASQAGIPVIGPILAGSAMVAMLSMVQGLLGSLPSAATGWDRVPYDMPVMVHQGERITPRYDADRMDAALSGAGGGTYNVTIQALDARSLSQLMHDNPDAILGPLSKAVSRRRWS